MAKCPKCQNDIKDDFGLVTCSNCGAQVLISMDGSSEIAPASDHASTHLENVLVSEIEEGEDSGSPVREHSVRENSVRINSVRVATEIVAIEENDSLQMNSEPPPPPPLEDFAPTRPTPSTPHAPQERAVATTSDMSEVAEFGNSSASLAREGSLRFDIFLSGIDTVDIRKQVQEALTDERFLWDAEALVGHSQNGELKISDVSAVKSSLIIQRLRTVSIDIRWEQYAIHQ